MRSGDRIAESTAIPAITAEIECLRVELAAALRKWRVATLARELVRQTLQEFTHTRQPAVLEEASAAFARITAGAYERILQEEDGESLAIVDRCGRRKRPEELSRGTAEQLYLCLRLGLAAEFARSSVSLPLIMDDVLVNFDPERALARRKASWLASPGTAKSWSSPAIPRPRVCSPKPRRKRPSSSFPASAKQLRIR